MKIRIQFEGLGDEKCFDHGRVFLSHEKIYTATIVLFFINGDDDESNLDDFHNGLNFRSVGDY